MKTESAVPSGACPFFRTGREKFAVVDVGSNSVRLLLLGERDEKFVATTRLSAGLSESGEMAEESMERTALAVADFAAQARAFCGGVFIFGTEAVRKAKNREKLIVRVKELCGETLEVLSGREEALCGFLGVSDGAGEIGVIDIGGASTEFAHGNQGPDASVSLAVGTVRLFDRCGRDRAEIREVLSEFLDGYSAIPHTGKLFAIGGTATTLASTLIGRPYDRSKVHGFEIERSALSELSDRLFSLEIEQIRELPGMDPRRADVVAGGAELLRMFMERYGYSRATVSETDNLEGYLRFRGLI